MGHQRCASKNESKSHTRNQSGKSGFSERKLRSWLLRSCKYKTFIYFGTFFHKPNWENNHIWFVQENNLDKTSSVLLSSLIWEDVLLIQLEIQSLNGLFAHI